MQHAGMQGRAGHTGGLTGFNEVETNLRQMFRHLAQRRAQGDVKELAGLSVASAGSSFQMFNAAFFSSPVVEQTDLNRRIALAKVLFAARGLDWSLWVCEELLAKPLRGGLIRSCEKAGLHFNSEMPAMIAERIPPPAGESPPLNIQLVTGPNELRQFCRIGAQCFRVPLDWFMEIYDHADRLTGSMCAWVGYFEGKAVATVATIKSGDVIGIYNLATAMPFRKRGFGEAMLRNAVQEICDKTGETVMVLQSTRLGQNLYKRLGFRGVGRILVFASE